MKTKTLALAVLASVIAATAAVPSFAAMDSAKKPMDPAKKQKHVERMINRVDQDGDKKVSHAEMTQALDRTFDIVDTNHDGKLTKEEVANRKTVMKAHIQKVKASGEKPTGLMRMPKGSDKHFDKLDVNHDGVISKDEIGKASDTMFARRDKNKDGYLSADDFKS